MTEREVHIQHTRQALASMETESLYKCIRFIAKDRSCVFCGSARVFLESKLAVCRGNLFYWLENEAPMGIIDWLADTENFCHAIWAA